MSWLQLTCPGLVLAAGAVEELGWGAIFVPGQCRKPLPGRRASTPQQKLPPLRYF